jgi:hypothetical protein
MERMVDAKVARYRNNPLAKEIVANVKQEFRKGLLQEAGKERNAHST